ncbi:MAG: histidinol-phosphatase [Oscillospiraceae bacterium]|nr:histidinol-phosphatase [Oscillospiraceae bacterium]
MLVANYHTHTKRCKHASGTDREYIEAAIQAGIRILGFSDHMPWVDAPEFVRSRMDVSELDDYFQSLSDLKTEYRDRIEIHLGFEAEFYPDLMEHQLKVLEQYPCEYLLLGQHFSSHGPGTAYYGRPFDSAELLQQYTDLAVQGLERGAFLYLAHPDLPNFQGDPGCLNACYEQLIDAALRTDTPLEINVLGLRGGRNYPNPDFVALAARRGCRMIVGVDAHAPEQLLSAELIAQAQAMATDLGVTPEETLPL